MSAKYICMKNEVKGIEEIIVFPEHIHHDCAFEMMSRIKNQSHGSWERERRKIVSAGFVDYEGNCFGRSETLGVVSRERVDTELLADQYR